MERTEEHRSRWDTDSEAAIAVVKAVAGITNTDPFELRPLHSVMDTSVLEAIGNVDPERTWRLEFEYDGVRIKLDNTGNLCVTRSYGH